MSSPDSDLKLQPAQLAALVILMAEARELTNNDFEKLAKFRLTGDEHGKLVRLGLIDRRKAERGVLAFQLTDKGWSFCKKLHDADVNVGGSKAARSIFVLLGGLERSLERLHVSHADFFKQPTEVTTEAKPIAPASAEDVEARIRKAYADLPKSDGWVGLADLRDRLAGLDRAAVDDSLRAMVRQEEVRIIPVANTKSLDVRDRAAALRIGDEDNHALWIAPA